MMVLCVCGFEYMHFISKFLLVSSSSLYYCLVVLSVCVVENSEHLGTDGARSSHENSRRSIETSSDLFSIFFLNTRTHTNTHKDGFVKQQEKSIHDCELW